MRRFVFLSLSFFLIGCSVQSAQGRLLPASSPSAVASSNRAAKRMQHRSSVASVRRSSASSVVLHPPEHYSIPILVYHHVRPSEGWGKETWSYKMSVTPEAFAKQMQWLEDHGYTTVSLDTFLKIRSGVIPGPQKPAVITFDDNNTNAYVNAFPILKKHFFTATWYVITSRFDKPSFLTSDQIKELSKAGMDIQSHSVTHPWLTSLFISQQRWELDESRKAIEALTGKPVRHLAYPLTMQNAQVRRVVAEEGYVTGTIMDPRPATEKDDPLKLPRIMMTEDTELEGVLP